MYNMIIVDDEPLERKAIQHIVEKNALPVKVIGTASNGIEAVDLIQKLNPHIVVMDIKMPGINGFEVMESILYSHPHIKVIILSAYDDYDYIQKALKLGAFDYIIKPAHAQEIIKAMHRLLGNFEFMQSN